MTRGGGDAIGTPGGPPRAWAREVLAGLAGAIGSVPDGMATAVLAGTGPMTGLYASFAGPVAGGVLQSTDVMVIATTSAAAVTANQAMAGAEHPAATLSTLAVLAGALMLVATFLGAARLLRFVSASVMSGFIFGVGLILVVGQLGDATGVSASGPSVAAKAWDTFTQWRSFDPASMGTAVLAVAIAVASGRGRLAPVAPLLAIVVPSVVLRLVGVQVATVESTSGAVAVGLPNLVLPRLSALSLDVISTAAALTVVVLVQAAGVGVAYPNAHGPANDVQRDFVAQGGANIASGLVGGIPVGGSVGQTALNVMAGGRTRWAVILSGLWMLVFVIALGPLLSAVPIPALAGLLILAGVGSLRPRELVRSWRTSPASGAAAVLTLVATLVVPVHLAVLLGVLLSLVLVGVTGASAVSISALNRSGDGSWTRGEPPAVIAPGDLVVLDIDGSGAFTSVAGTFARLPRPPMVTDRSPGQRRCALVVRLRGHIRTTMTFAKALERYAGDLERAEGVVIVCGLHPEAIAQLRSAGLPDAITLVAQGRAVDGSLAEAYALAGRWISGA